MMSMVRPRPHDAPLHSGRRLHMVWSTSLVVVVASDMRKNFVLVHGYLLLVLCVGIGSYTGLYTAPAYATTTATTTVSLTVCGDAIVSGGEICDDGSNTGAYAGSIATRSCNPLCAGYGPYCGDSVIQVFYGEECDDGNNTAGDLCDVTCQNESDPVTEGGGGSGGGGGGGGGNAGGTGQTGIRGASKDGTIDFNGDTDVVIRGIAYPGATITILRDGEIERVVEADSSGSFDYTLTGQTPGITTFGFWALDGADRSSITYSATFQIIENAVTTLSGILIPPTLVAVPERVAPGESISFQGTAAAGTNVRAVVNDSPTPEETLASSNGVYSIAYDTTPLAAEQFHTVKANYVDTQNPELESGYSAIVNFYVGVQEASSGLTADLNNDGFVNLTDFSILLFNWNGTGGIADINGDGSVSLPDFSIMLFYWTG
jgi:cysteine-rich repeat protein